MKTTKQVGIKILVKQRVESAASSSDLFDVDEIAEEAGINTNYVSLFAYMFRRFGFPKINTDDYKCLTGYMLTTSIKGLYLRVNPSPSGVCHFGYGISQQLKKEIYKPVMQLRNAYRKNLEEWIASTGRVPCLMPEDCNDSSNPEKLTAVIRNWHTIHPEYKGVDGGEKEMQLFWEYQFDLRQQYYREFEEATGSKCLPLRYDMVEPGSLHDQARNALKESLQDLLIPTYVRDVYFNANGIIKDSEVNEEYYEYSKQSGLGIESLIKRAKAI